MDSNFLKDFDQIFNEILVDLRGQDPDIDTSKGSIARIRAACLASACWGIYRHQEWISDQIFPDTADPVNMEHHAWVEGILRRAGESDEQLLARDLDDRRRPPAGGNQYDYAKWARAVDGVKEGYVVPLGQGMGSVDVVIVADNDSGVPDQALLDKTTDFIQEKRPAGMRYLRVMAPVAKVTGVTVKYRGDVAASVIEADILAFISQLVPGEDFVRAVLSHVLIADNDLADLEFVLPAANVVTTPYERVTAGDINVTKL